MNKTKYIVTIVQMDIIRTLYSFTLTFVLSENHQRKKYQQKACKRQEEKDNCRRGEESEGFRQ